ncbi:peptidase A24A prepilin type IV (plasmid) [Pseudarthrobacter chlorophenolicus A6]|uniref:Peptidase A24A prepilin type IV n=1 Tax=Pseudarthrobacter chlorophenolicus (strain ATCC 700700 / DSM 12829 / CIP 107037 / JCM 12360 / KCTC 9906 / NCIMB 13794 / A6) TaxID=452863 RepID=B8HI62_PSECP|nr:A24 family peptidase [Pseudarthrobacter chlorophenolicus]ACL42109.1 peptidase A24A prepilin type IV [Pseudarthrobacter chlorophenolicus A6]SDQ13550.1 leader peptidase (prepilin peptidase) / N-methyltransferase [Pseudarthrobacter chlorophenolicus]
MTIHTTPAGTPLPDALTAEEVEIIPDVDEPWLPSVLNLETGLPTAAVAAGTAMLGFWVNAGRGPLVAGMISLLTAALVFLAVIDWKTHRLPNAIVLPMYPAFGLAVAVGAVTGSITVTAALTAAISMAAAFAVLWLVAFFTGGLGFGDVKLGGVLGLVCGLESGYAAALGALLLPMMLGGLVALPLMFAGRRKQEFAFGPYMVAGALLILLLPGVIEPISRGSLF